MTDFNQFESSTHPIVRLEDDYNNLLDHGLVKAASYIVRVNGSYYEAIDGSTGLIAFGGEDNAGAATGTLASDVINAAITALTSGGLIYVMDGTYNITLIIDFADDVVIAGSGSGTIFNLTADIASVFRLSTVYRCQLYNVKIVGNKASRADGIGIHLTHAGAFATEQNHKFENVIIEDMKSYGVYAEVTGGGGSDSFRNVRFNNVTVKNCDTHGFHYTIADSCFTDCVSLENDNAASGFYDRGGCNTHLGCRAYNNDGVGFDYSESSKAIYMGCEASNNGTHGFCCNAASGLHQLTSCKAHDNDVGATGAVGFWFNGSTEVTLIGCTGYNSTGTTPQEFGITGTLHNSTIVGGSFHDNANSGIYLTGGGSENTIIGCEINDNAGDGIHLDGETHINVANNMITGNGAYAINLNANCDYGKITSNSTNTNTTACVNVGNANCDNNAIHNNNFDEGNIVNAGTNTRAWLNYDPSANTFIVTINPPAVVGGGGGNLP